MLDDATVRQPIDVGYRSAGTAVSTTPMQMDDSDTAIDDDPLPVKTRAGSREHRCERSVAAFGYTGIVRDGVGRDPAFESPLRIALVIAAMREGCDDRAITCRHRIAIMRRRGGRHRQRQGHANDALHTATGWNSPASGLGCGMVCGPPTPTPHWSIVPGPGT